MKLKLIQTSPGSRTQVAFGFTLVEVLVALAIASIALIAALRAVESLVLSSQEIKLRTYAQWSAENRLSQIRITSEFPNVGKRNFDCPQAEMKLACVEDVFQTPNASFRRVEVTVNDTDGRRVAKLTGFATNM
jgi:general secretion pathway protein I